MAAKLLLVEDVDSLGKKGDIVDAKPGYARNFLIPKRLAIFADRNALRMQARLQEERRQKAEEDRAESEGIKAKIDGKAFTFEVKVDHDGHMYGSVSVLDLVHRLHDELGIEVDKRGVLLKHPIKATGVHDVTLRFKEEVEATIHVKVLAEGVLEHEEAAPEAEGAQEESQPQ